MATVKFWQGMDKASNIVGADKMMIGKNETGEAQYVDFQDANQFLSIQGIEMKPVPAGALPAGPAGETRTMEILEAGTWTWNGQSFVNPSGGIMKLWWDGTTWSLGSSVALPMPTGVPVLNPVGTGIPTEKATADYVKASSIFYQNNSYNMATGGITIFDTKIAAREATPLDVRKRGLTITYRVAGQDGWVIEQYVGSANAQDWIYADSSFVDLSRKNTSGDYVGYSTPTYDQVTRVLTIPSGVISTNDGRRINTVGSSFTIDAGFWRLVSTITGVLSIQAIDANLNTFLSNEQIDITSFYLAGNNSKLLVVGDDFPLFGQALRDQDERVALLNNTASQIDFDLINRLLKIKGGAVIDSSAVTTGRINLPIVDLPLISSITAGVVLLNRSNNTIVIRNQTDRPLKNHFILFTYQYSGSLASFVVQGITNYFVNGVKVTPTIEKVAVLNNKESDINFDLANRTIYINGGAVIDDSGVSGRINLPISTVNMPSSMPNAVVLYDKTANTIIVRNQASAPIGGTLILFTYQYTGIQSDFVVNGLSRYQINGINNNKIDFRAINLFGSDNFGVSFWNSPVQPSATIGDDVNLYSFKSTQLYPMYDSLVASFPNNVVKSKVGTTDSGFDVFRIDISFNRKTATLERRRKPRIFLCAGTHGGEAVGVYTTYLFFKKMLENADNDEILNVLKYSYDWTLIPLVNPFALDVGVVNGVSSVRWNHNGVDINRNFDYRWANYADGGVGSQTYKGTAPFSEKESQFVRDVFNSIKDNVVLYLDCHNYGGSSMSDKRSVWFAASNDTAQNIIDTLCDRLDFEAKKRWSYIPKDKWTAFSTLDFTSPMSQAWISNQQILATTLETDQTDSFNSADMSNFTSNVITRSLETYVNTFYSLGSSGVYIANKIIR